MIKKIQKYDIFGILETWMVKQLLTVPQFMSEFEMLQIPATKEDFSVGRPSGGIILFVKEQTGRQNIHIITSNEKFIIFKTIMREKSIIVCLAYLNPKLCLEMALNELLDCVTTISQDHQDCPFLIMGDFNARMDQLNQVDETIVTGTHLFKHRTSLDTESNKRGRAMNKEMSREMVSPLLMEELTQTHQGVTPTYTTGVLV